MLTRTAKKEDQVESRLRLQRVAGGHNGRRTVQTVRWTSCITPWASLTFDDGPDPLWTPRILDALERVDVRATFFVITPLALKHRQLVAEALGAGHEVEADTREGLQVVRSLGIEPQLWRPPWGVRAPWTEEVAEEFGLRLASWSV